MKNTDVLIHPPIVLFIHHSTQISGAEISLKLILENLDRNKFTPVLVLPDKGPFYKYFQNKILVHIIPMSRIKRTKNLFLILGYLINITITGIKILWIIQREKINLVHCNSSISRLNALLPSFISSAPVIWQIRDIRIPPFIVKLLSLHSDSIISISKCISVQLNLQDRKNVNLINNGMDVHSLKINPGLDIRKNAGINPSTKIIAQIGQLIPWKRHIDFILSAEKVLSIFTNVKFFIIGSDIFEEFKTYKEELQQLIRNRNLESSFHFIDQVDDISSVLNCIDILFHPAIDEPFGRIIIEAMFLQKPVIAANSCGPQEVIIDGETGFLFRPSDLDNMAERMINLLENPQLCIEFGLAGKKRVENHFNIQEKVKSLEDIFDNLLNR